MSENKCTLSNEDLLQQCEQWVHKLAKSGGKDWCLQVPVNFNKDPDMLFMELINRFKAQHGSISNDSVRYELRLALYDMIRVTRALIENRGTILSARKRIEAAEAILKKHFKITDILRDEAPKESGPIWVKASDRLPEIVDKKCKTLFVKVEEKRRDGSLRIKKAVAYYFPEHFKTVEWEDWDDYSEEDFPYTENDEEKGIVWLRPGWYSSIECDKCEGYWSAPLNVIEWYDE